ncbi:hypothetical protein N5T57_10215 [Aliarcobacter cryaerophilus]|uniref:hypothetical protein n=1 Tax=Aliarcobacter cryaerophilus TaxID=28198 RepID=UPI0021B38EDB|nr:hypothetical protein [Aliarcobacter cryaerophilus]MCT7523299.1 hypothetical protein [Aliarcobacter cryaerophilus]
MKNLKKTVIGLSLGLSILLTGCGDTAYTKEQLKVDTNNKIVYEKDGKTLANGSFSFKKSNEEGTINLDNGLVQKVVINKGNEKMEVNYKDKKIQSLDFGKYSKIECFDNGELKYIEVNDAQAKGLVKFNKGEKLPYYVLNEAKPSNSKIVFENDVLTISKLNNNQVIETHKKDSQRTEMVLNQVTNIMKNMANMLGENSYNEALNEIVK